MDSGLGETMWERATRGGPPGEGPAEQALAAVLRFHGPAMRGGLVAAIEQASAEERAVAASAYRAFGLDGVAALIERAAREVGGGLDADDLEVAYDREYWGFLPDDQALRDRFLQHLAQRQEPAAP